MRAFLLLLMFVGVLAVGVAIGLFVSDPGEGDTTSSKAAAVTVGPAGEDVGSLELEVDDDAVAASAAASEVLDEVDLASMLARLDDELLLTEDITVRVEDDPDEAYYDPEARVIVLSPSLVESTASIMDEQYESKEDALVAAASSVRFTVLHELGHALVDTLELPITGLEETAVDQFAVVALVDLLEDPVAVLEASDEFDALAVEPQEADFYDEHALDQQRFFNLRCLVFGTDPEQYADELAGLDLDDGREELCVEESERVRASWNQLLAPYLAA